MSELVARRTTLRHAEHVGNRVHNITQRRVYIARAFQSVVLACLKHLMNVIKHPVTQWEMLWLQEWFLQSDSVVGEFKMTHFRLVLCSCFV